MNDRHHITDESFEQLAREAGAALRRPAPADGVRAVRATRRRQQQTRAVVGAALAAIIAVGAAVVLRDDPSSTTIVVQPDDTAVDSTDGATVTTVPAGTVPTTDASPTTEPAVTVPPSAPVTTPIEPIAGLSDDAIAWRDARVADGFTFVDIIRGQGTTARLLTAQRPDPQAFESAVLLDDGRVIELPDGFALPGTGELYAVGGRPALLDIGADNLANEMAVWQLDPASGEWASSGDLGLGAIDSATAYTVVPYSVSTVGDVLLVAVEEYQDAGDGSLAPSAARRGVVVRGDLSTTPMAVSPDGVPMDWSVVAGGKALQIFGQNLGSLVNPPHPQPWAYDPASNSWSEIPLPDWFDCSSDPAACDWTTMFDGGVTLQVVTDRGVLVGVPDGTLGLYDPDANTWRQVDAPFTDQGWWSAADLGDRVVLAPGRLPDGDVGTIGVLDLATATVTATEIDIPPAIQQRIDTEWGDVRWDLRSTGSRVMAVPGPPNGSDEAPIAAYDATTGVWEDPTATDLSNWDLLATSLAG